MTADRKIQLGPGQTYIEKKMAYFASGAQEEIDQLYEGVITKLDNVGGSATAITADAVPPIDDYHQARIYELTLSEDLGTAPHTININGLGAIPLKGRDGQDIVSPYAANTTLLLRHEVQSNEMRVISMGERGERGPVGVTNWRGEWVSGENYIPLDTVVGSDGKIYFSKSTHTSDSTTEPGHGSNWQNVWQPISPPLYVSPENYGAKADGVTDDTSAIQAAVDSGGVVILGRGTYLVTQSIILRNRTTISGTYVGSGTNIDGFQAIKYTGTGPLFVTQGDIDNTFIRGVSLNGVSAFITNDGASFAKIKYIRDWHIENCTAVLGANNQRFVILDAVKNTSALGVFDGVMLNCASTAASQNLSGIIHLELLGDLNNGQPNSNTFINNRFAGAGVGVYIKTGYNNVFIGTDFEALTEDIIQLDLDATYNSFIDSYIGDMPSTWNSFVFNCMASGVKYNQMLRYKAGSPASRFDVNLTPHNFVVTIEGQKIYAPGDAAQKYYRGGETFSRIVLDEGHLTFRDSSATYRKYVGPEIDKVYEHPETKTLRPDYVLGKHNYMKITTSGGVAIPTPLHMGDGLVMRLELENASGGTINLTFNVAYKGERPTQIADGEHVIVTFTKRGNDYPVLAVSRG